MPLTNSTTEKVAVEHRSLVDVDGIMVGHATDEAKGTGLTVVLCPEGMRGGAYVGGHATSTRQFDTFTSMHASERVHAVLLTGGSAFGLSAAEGVMRYLKKYDYGTPTTAGPVPSVPSAVIYDLNVGEKGAAPSYDMAYEACMHAEEESIPEGCVGAGTGATVGKALGITHAMKSGIGTWSVEEKNGLVVGALAVVNAFGDVRDPATGRIIAGARDPDTKAFADTLDLVKRGMLRKREAFMSHNTTLAVIATNAAFTREELSTLSRIADHALVKTIAPVHTRLDGDIVIALSSERMEDELHRVAFIAEEVLTMAILRAVRSARGRYGLPGLNKTAPP